MFASSSPGVANADRPNRPLVVKCAYDNTSRRITFPSAATCKLDTLLLRVSECFHLSISPFHLRYTDDDGEDFAIHSESDLTEAVLYFLSGDDDQALSAHSGGSGRLGGFGAGGGAAKVTIRVEVVLEYDGPSLSDTSSIRSFETGSGSASGLGSGSGTGWEDSTGYSGSMGGWRDAPSERQLPNSLDALNLGDSVISATPGSTTPRRQSKSRTSCSSLGPATVNGHAEPPAPLTGPESDPAPSLLTHSELGSRWLREQSRLATRRTVPSRRSGPTGRYDSDEESLGSDEELGDLELVRDARGKYYYAYQTDAASSSHSFSDLDSAPSVRTASPPLETHADPLPPILAPDCSACGVRLTYMRYVCQTCGEGEMWKEDAPDKAAFVPPRVPSEGGTTESSGESEGTMVQYTLDGRSRSGSISTNASRESLRVATGSAGASSPKEAHFLGLGGPTPPDSPRASPATLESRARGYELCPGCVEAHGVAHSRAAAKEARKGLTGRSRKRDAGLRHTFQEKIWGREGWQDVEYNEDSECTICRSLMFSRRFKCISCSKFNLCRSCYQKVDEIHPAHAFLSLPDKPLPQAGPSQARTTVRNGVVQPGEARPVRHPGAFCHNCLQDIVGPRFHCAVCPSWDLCIQCEGVAATGNGGHTPDHIMMKIPIPLETNEVEAVSRLARDRWFQQDFSLTNAPSSRSSSPTNETVYAGGSARGSAVRRNPTPQPPPAQVVNLTGRDALDHGCRCANCNEWVMGKRFQCANCPSDPQPYSLCSICELRSYRIHNPLHVFFRFDRPVHIPLASTRPLLPVLYRSPVGQIPASAVGTINARDPTAYLKHVLHRETLCDIHGDQIRGVWLRCGHCAAGFDICQEAEGVADHDPTHVFVVFKARVDMAAFRQLADLAATHSKPLIRQQVYLS